MARVGWSIRWKRSRDDFPRTIVLPSTNSPAPCATVEVDEVFGIANEYALRSKGRLCSITLSTAVPPMADLGGSLGAFVQSHQL